MITGIDMTLEEFESAEWEHVSTQVEDISLNDIEIEKYDGGYEEVLSGSHHVTGWQCLKTTHHNTTIYLTIDWTAEAEGETYSDLFEFYISPLRCKASLDFRGEEYLNLTLDDGYTRLDCSLGDVINKEEIREILPKKQTHTLKEKDMTEMNNEMQYSDYELTNTYGRDIAFKGYLLASAETSPNNASSDYSGSVGEWQELTLYKTKGGKFVCYREDFTQWQFCHNRHTVRICQTYEEVIEFFGTTRLAKELYDEANITHAVQVE